MDLNRNSLIELLGKGYTCGHLGTPNKALQKIFSKHKLEMADQKMRRLNPVSPIFEKFSADLTEGKSPFSDRLLRTTPLVQPAMKKLHSCFENAAKQLNSLVLDNSTLEKNKKFNTTPLSYIFKTELEHYEIFSKDHSTIQHNHIDYGSGKLSSYQIKRLYNYITLHSRRTA
jgi:hypothetical protein